MGSGGIQNRRRTRSDRRDGAPRSTTPDPGEVATWPFGDHPSPYTFRGQLVQSRQAALAIRRMLRTAGGRRWLVAMVLGPWAVLGMAAVLQALV